MTASPAALSPSTFRARLVAGERLIGTFIKTPTSHAVEILGDVGFDFVVIDEEHAPFDRMAIDGALLAARAAGTAGLVRVSALSHVLSALDCGAAGVLVPHVSSAAVAREVAAAGRYRGGRRGYSASARAGRYGATPMAAHIASSDAATAVIAMIEDPEALDEIDAIVATDGIDGVFIGRGDLTVAFGAPSQDAPPVKAAVDQISAAARRAGKAVCVMVGGAIESQAFRALGASAFIVSSDQGFMRRAAGLALADMAAIKF